MKALQESINEFLLRRSEAAGSRSSKDLGFGLFVIFTTLLSSLE